MTNMLCKAVSCYEVTAKCKWVIMCSTDKIDSADINKDLLIRAELKITENAESIKKTKMTNISVLVAVCVFKSGGSERTNVQHTEG